MRRNPSAFNNTATREKAAAELQSIVIDSIKVNPSYLSEIPVLFNMVLKKEDTYLVKFTRYSFGDNTCEAGDTQVAFDLFSEVDESFIAQLVDNNYYYVSGTFMGSVNNTLTLPSGDHFTQKPSLSKDYKVTANLGGLYVKDIVVTPVRRYIGQ